MTGRPGPGALLDACVGPFPGRLSKDLLRAYAVATRDPSARAQRAEAVPVTALVTQVWHAQEAARAACVSERVQTTATGGVHGEHDIVVHRPLVAEEPLQTWVRGHSARPAGRNAVVTLHYETRDGEGALVAEQWWTTVYLGTTCATEGPLPPEHRFPDGARHVDSRRVTVDTGMAARYAEVSGDWSPHHFDAEAALRTGAERPFLHGLATLALCGQAVTAVLADGDPSRIRRLAVRFAAPLLIGDDLEVACYEASSGRYAFGADAGGRPVVTLGLAELRAGS
jgi:acyl dehydratase